MFGLCQAGADKVCVLYERTVQLDILYKKELLKKVQLEVEKLKLEWEKLEYNIR